MDQYDAERHTSSWSQSEDPEADQSSSDINKQQSDVNDVKLFTLDETMFWGVDGTPPSVIVCTANMRAKSSRGCFRHSRHFDRNFNKLARQLIDHVTFFGSVVNKSRSERVVEDNAEVMETCSESDLKESCDESVHNGQAALSQVVCHVTPDSCTNVISSLENVCVQADWNAVMQTNCVVHETVLPLTSNVHQLLTVQNRIQNGDGFENSEICQFETPDLSDPVTIQQQQLRQPLPTETKQVERCNSIDRSNKRVYFESSYTVYHLIAHVQHVEFRKQTGTVAETLSYCPFDQKQVEEEHCNIDVSNDSNQINSPDDRLLEEKKDLVNNKVIENQVCEMATECPEPAIWTAVQSMACSEEEVRTNTATLTQCQDPSSAQMNCQSTEQSLNKSPSSILANAPIQPQSGQAGQQDRSGDKKNSNGQQTLRDLLNQRVDQVCCSCISNNNSNEDISRRLNKMVDEVTFELILSEMQTSFKNLTNKSLHNLRSASCLLSLDNILFMENTFRECLRHRDWHIFRFLAVIVGVLKVIVTYYSSLTKVSSDDQKTSFDFLDYVTIDDDLFNLFD